MALEVRVDRHEPRVPFFAPVVATGLRRCWATNISSGGIGLTAFSSTATPPSRGDELELELQLGDSKTTIQVLGRVAWTSMVRPDGRFGLGAQFWELSATARTQLALFLAEHRPRAIVALASPAERELAQRALGTMNIEFVTDLASLDPDLLRACSSIVVFSHDVKQLEVFLATVEERSSDQSPLPGFLPFAPITVCTSIESDALLPLFTDGKIYQVLRPPFERRALGHAVERSCERWALQLELKWASLQLEGMARTQQLAATTRMHEPTRGSVNVVRESPAMQRVYELIATVAIHDVPVLLVGETGTGKELAAREIHALSKRANTPFVAQDCGALTETLLESELFGHVRGAFTGAATDHPGLFQIADGGTIFLDEIQNTSPALQAKLLRVVEQGEVRPVGGAKARRVDVRLIAACNVDLKAAVREGRFRADFFYRLNRFPIELPPLREHTADILPLTQFFLDRLGQQMGRPHQRIDTRAERALVSYDWPGNIRELRNAIERAILLTPPDEPLRWEALPAEVRGSDQPTSEDDRGLEAQVNEFERRLIRAALDRNEGIIRRAARDLSVNAVTLARRMKRLGLG
ncbi:MAG: sigma 54-interacting transcriptional regulator [Kofleriaceae bacterium]|nr:sigma 54-interacting transcriptional regulator [Kofleriaceae bacterium]